MKKRTSLPEDLGKARSAIREVVGDGAISVFITRSKHRINTPKYVMVFTYANDQLIVRLPVKGYLLLAFLYSHIGNANVITISCNDIALKFKKHISSIYGALKVLRSNNVVLKINGNYHISPQVCWCGSLVQWKQTIENLRESERVKIPIEREKKKINRFNEIVPFVSSDAV